MGFGFSRLYTGACLRGGSGTYNWYHTDPNHSHANGSAMANCYTNTQAKIDFSNYPHTQTNFNANFNP
jgi:hypothetical protein